MKNLTKNLKSIHGRFLLSFMLSILALFSVNAQANWDYVNFQGNTIHLTGYGNCGATIDQNDNVYSLEYYHVVGSTSSYISYLRLAKYTNGVFASASANISNSFYPAGASANSTLGYNSVTHFANKTYVAGSQGSNGVIQSFNASLTASVFKTIIPTAGRVQITGIDVKNNYVYVIGSVQTTSSVTVNFGTGFSAEPFAAAGNFIAKYDLSGNCQFVTVTGPQTISDKDIIADLNGDMYITYSDNFSVEVKKYSSSGVYDAAWGTKNTVLPSGGERWVDLKLDPNGQSIYSVAANKVLNHSTSGSGSLIWTKTFTNIGINNPLDISQIALNNCGVIYATGNSHTQAKTTMATFFCAGSDKTVGGTVNFWASNGSTRTPGTGLVVGSDDKARVLGYYTKPFTLDASTTTPYQSPSFTSSGGFSSGKGTFMGRVDDAANNNCCDPLPITLTDRTECIGTSTSPFIYIGSQLGGIPLNQLTINWYFNGVLIGANSPVQFLMAPGGSSPQPGVYSVEIFFPNCLTPVTASMTYTLINCGNNCEITPKFRIEEEGCVFKFFNETTFGGNTTIKAYHWDFGDGSTSILENPSHTFSNKGNHTITLTVYGIDDEGNCCSETFSETIYIPEHCAPKACNIKAKMKLHHIGYDILSFQSTSFSLGSTNIIAYEWTVNGIVVSNSPSFTQRVDYGMNHICLTVFAVNSDGECCEETFCDEIEIEKGDERRDKMLNDEFVNSINISPNPSKGFFSIQLDNKNNSKATIQVFNSTGKVIKNTSTNSSEYLIDLSAYSSGIYFVKIEMDGNYYTEKIVKN